LAIAAALTISLTVTEGVVAQSEKDAAGSRKPFAKRLSEALNKTGNWSFVETPLEEVAEDLSRSADIEIVVDSRSLEDYGIVSDVPVSFEVSGIQLRSALTLMLRELDMTWDVSDDAIRLTTLDEAEMNTGVRVYPVDDLIRTADSSMGLGDDYDSIIDLITSTIDPTSWDNVGGCASAAALPGTLVISQTRGGHAQIADLLDAWRLLIARSEEDAKARRQPIRLREEADARVLEALAKPVQWSFLEEPFEDVAENISRECDIPVVIDTRALEEYGMGRDFPVTRATAKIPLRTAMRRLLTDLDLTTVISHEVLLITTVEEAEALLSIVIYPVADLVATNAEATPGSPDFDSLQRAIHACIAPESWDQVGGPGTLEVIVNPPALVVAQTDEVHTALHEMLEQIRAKRPAPQVVEAPAKRSRHRLQVYRLEGPLAAYQMEVMTLIRRVVQPESWETDRAVFIEPLGSAFVVQHTDEAHHELENLLRKIRSELPMMGGFGGGMGGFFGTPPGSASAGDPE
jgi:hypothetical protein